MRDLPLLMLGCAYAGSLVSCGEATPESQMATMAVALPLPMPLASCPERTALGLALEAVLEIGGHDACSLAVDPTTLQATGNCNAITVGIVRPLGLRYGYLDSDNPSIALGYLLGFVDLRLESLASVTTEVTVNLDPNSGAAKFLTVDADVDALRPRSACVDLSEVEVNLCAAEAWAKNRFDNELQIDFDSNDDGQNNLTEACNGTLIP